MEMCQGRIDCSYEYQDFNSRPPVSRDKQLSALSVEVSYRISLGLST
jgi:hypothetical protein